MVVDCSAVRRGTSRDDRFWVGYWGSRSGSETDEFAALCWYHRIRLVPAAARGEWFTLAARLRITGRMGEHYGMLGWWEPTGLTVTTALTPDLGQSFIILGNEYAQASLGNRPENLRRAMACYEAAQRVLTEADFPQQWATTQNNLGHAYLLRGQFKGNRLDLTSALACFEAAERGFRRVGRLDDAQGAQRQADDVRRRLG